MVKKTGYDERLTLKRFLYFGLRLPDSQHDASLCDNLVACGSRRLLCSSKYLDTLLKVCSSISYERCTPRYSLDVMGEDVKPR